MNNDLSQRFDEERERLFVSNKKFIIEDSPHASDRESSLESLFCVFLQEGSAVRNKGLDKDNISFHLENELKLKAPVDWVSWKPLISALNKTCQNKDVFIFYSDTKCYRNFFALFDNNESLFNARFCSFYELQCAVMSAPHDIRQQQRILNEVSESSIVVVLDASRCIDMVLNAIRQYTNGGLILIG